MFELDPRDLTDSRDRYSEDVYDPRWGEDPRDRDERDRDVDGRDRDPRDPFVDGLELPRGLERELVQDERENLYELNGEDARMLATVRAGQADVKDVPAGLELAAASKRLRAARFRARYRMWQVEPYNALADLYSHILPDQLARGEGRVELVELPHQYLRLTSLVGVA